MHLRKLLLLLLLFSGFTYSIAHAQMVPIQFINNNPDPLLQNVDIYINHQLAFNDIDFRTASPFLPTDIGGLGPIANVAIAMGNSTSVNDTFFSINYTFNPSKQYIIISSGIKATSGYSPQKPVSIEVIEDARLNANISSNTDILFFQGCTDAPVIDFKTGISTLVNDLNYTQASSYIEISAATDKKIRITNAKGDTTLYTYMLDLSTSLLANSAITLISSGFIDPAANKNGPGFELSYATRNGGPLIQLLNTTPEAIARLQLINNSADTKADEIDVYIGGEKRVENLPFNHATEYMDVIADVASTIAIAPKTSVSQADAFQTTNTTFLSGKMHAGVINGIASTTGYNPAPAISTLLFTNNAREIAATAGNTDFMFINGSTDAPSLSLSQGSTVLANNIAYNTSTSGYASVPTTDGIFTVTNTTTSDIIQTCTAPLLTSGLQNKAVTIVASGFITPANNSNGPEFKLYAAPPTGGAMILLPPIVGVKNISNNTNFSISPNPAVNYVRIHSTINTSPKINILDISGRKVISNHTTSNGYVDVSALQAGLYFITITDEASQKTATAKFIKE